MRDRQYLGALRVREGVITLEQLHFADEIRPVDEIKPKRERVSQQELRMAQQLIDSFSSEWKPEKYEDTYREALMAVIEAKRKGKEVHVAPEVEDEEPTDLMEALRASLESTKRGRRRPRRAVATSNGSSDDELEELSKDELAARAKKAKIDGRSKMSKDELIDALRAA
jgi:DNA end-binding protein Ku